MFKRVGELVAVMATILFFMYQETPSQQPVKTPRPATSGVEIAYSVSMSKPWTHLLEVEMRLSSAAFGESESLKMPAWTPGSYLIREYARHVQDFSVRDASGRPLEWEKINKNTWRIKTSGVRGLIASYKVYSNELTVRTNELNDEHAFWNNAALLMFPDGRLGSPSTITVRPFGDWKVATGLPPVSGSVNTFRAENFDILYDSPFEVSNFKEISFNVLGKPHRYVVTGEGNYDLEQIAADTAKIIEESAKIFGGELPYDNYLFILNLRGSGGLEHLNSTALQWSRFGFKPESRYHAFLHLVAHEFFHVWNVKRIRPDSLGPFDYENENYTKLLWVAEGATAYYEGILLRRAGLITDKEFLQAKANMIEQLQQRPGRFETSLEEASLDAWIKYYRQDENAVNNQISYYDKGEIVNMMLDIVIRTASNGAKSLDDVMRYLNDEFYKKNRNYTPKDFQKAAELAAGKSLEDFFAKYVRGEAEIDYNGILSGVGLRLAEAEPNKGKGFLGVTTRESDGRVIVRAVPADTPAYQHGINANDELVAIDGNRITTELLNTYIAERKPGDKVTITVFRHDRLRELQVTLGESGRRELTFQSVATPTESQRAMYKAYLNADL